MGSSKLGRKVGQKRSDFHYTDESGEVWDSYFESKVYQGAVDAGKNVRRCTKGADTLPYFHNVPGASCTDCGSTRVGRARGITFDLFVTDTDTFGKENSYYLEPKGYMRAPKRALYRSFFKENPNTSVRFVLQSNYRVGKGTFGGWINKHLHAPWALWKGSWDSLVWTFPTVKNLVTPSVESHSAVKPKRSVKKKVVI